MQKGAIHWKQHVEGMSGDTVVKNKLIKYKLRRSEDKSYESYGKDGWKINVKQAIVP